MPARVMATDILQFARKCLILVLHSVWCFSRRVAGGILLEVLCRFETSNSGATAEQLTTNRHTGADGGAGLQKSKNVKKTRGPRGATFLFPRGTLRAARLEAKLTQEELANAAEVSLTTIRDAEAGKKPVSQDSAEAIAAHALGKTLDDFRRPASSPTSARDRSDVISSTDPDTPQVTFGNVAQATLAIAEFKPEDELRRRIFGANGSPQYEFISFCRRLRCCVRALDQASNSFPQFRLADAVFPKSVILHARLQVTNSSSQVAAFHIEGSSARDLIADPMSGGAPRIIHEVGRRGRF